MKLPSFAWILILLAAVGGVIALLFGGFWAVTTLPGFGSVIALVLGFFLFKADTSELGSSEGFVKAFLIVIFAGIGLGIDQPGNPVYNRPLEWVYCPAGTGLEHSAETQSASPGGGIRVNQRFVCKSRSDGNVVRQVGMIELLGIRLVEYILIGYLLTWIGTAYRSYKTRGN